ncbi:hypothetical protein KHQ81_01895 [Mycoplasmatota bacterium]|nr:hypothetical protein KHQ81_01895 [Mycoplasmatota bacterium]
MLVGKKFGDLTVIENVGKRRISNISKYDTTHYLCECGCGNEIIVSEPSLEYNIVKDCGCTKFKRKISK